MKNKRLILSVLGILFLMQMNLFAQKSTPNILFIEVDDLKYEYLSCMGSKIVNTPNIDQLAKTGIIFRNSVAQGSMCGPSRNCLMTGLYPHNLGFYQNGQMKALPENIWTFPQALQQSDYYTAWIGKCHIRPKGKDKTKGMEKYMGFDFVKQTEGRVVLAKKLKKKPEVASEDWYLSYLKEQGLLETFKKEVNGISTLPEEAYLDGFFTKEAKEFLSDYKEEKPFFLWLNYSVPHGPYDVEQKYHDLFSANDMPGTNKPNYEVPEGLVSKTKYFDNEPKHKKGQAGHSASVAFLDYQVGQIIDELKKNNQLENTLIVFFSDHGVMLGDHQRIHKGTLFRQVTNPSLIISYPKSFVKNKVNESAVELTDLVNTALDIAKTPTKAFNSSLTSNSLVPILEGKKENIRDYAFAEIEGYIMATDGRYRLIEGADASLLFDDLKDPKNLNNIANEFPEKVKLLSKAIKEWLEVTGEILPKNSY